MQVRSVLWGNGRISDGSAIRKQIEAQTMTWDKAIVDRTAELTSWVDFCYQIMKRGVLIYAYANNHFRDHGPATIAKFLELWAANRFGENIQTRAEQAAANDFISYVLG